MNPKALEKSLKKTAAQAVSVAAYDYATKKQISIEGRRMYHAASTIKVAILAGLAHAVAEGCFPFEGRLHVRNRFFSVADGSFYRISPQRDANADVHAARGKTMRISELAGHMITTSSNLATNLLLDLVGVSYVQRVLSRAGVDGVIIRRGVEDEAAFAAGINNEVSADGLLTLFRALWEEKFAPSELTGRMLDILAGQEFNRGIPAGLKSRLGEDVRIAHKTGEISTVAHDAGLVLPPDGEPVALVVLTEWQPEAGGRMEVVADTAAKLWRSLGRRSDD